MNRHFSKHCAAEFAGLAAVRVEEAPNEQVAVGQVLAERGQYVCQKCSYTIGECRVFAKGECHGADICQTHGTEREYLQG